MWSRIKTKVFIVLLLISLIPLVSSQEQYLGSFTQDGCVQLIQTCTNCTYVNVSSIELIQPTSEYYYGQEVMEKSGLARYNYTFCNTSTIGTYVYWTYGDPNGILSDPTGVTFEVSPLGLKQSTSQGLGSFGFLLLMIVLTFLFGFLGFRLSKDQTWWVLGIFFLFLSALMLIYDSWLGYEYHRLFTGLSDSGVPEVIFYGLLMIFVLGSLVTLALLVTRWKELFKYMKKEIKRKESYKEAEDWDYDAWDDGNKFGYGPK